MTAPAIFDLTGRTVFLTGAGQGLGQQMAIALAEAGASLALLDHTEEDLSETATILQGMDNSPLLFAADVRDADAIQAAVAQTAQHFGRLDICIPNAGISEARPGLLHELPPEDWQAVIDVNLGGVIHTIRPALSQMMPQHSGKLILVASMFGQAAPAGIFPRPAYAAAKGALVNLTRELALEYAPHGITANALLPGFFRTKTRPRTPELAEQMAAYTPLGRIADAEEIRGTIVYLASPATDFMTGTLLALDGGVLAR